MKNFLHRLWTSRSLRVWLLLLVLAAVALPFAVDWVVYRLRHSLTNDAFVEAHIVNVGPEQAAGHIVEVFAEEHDTVQPGQLLCQLDPKPYREQVDLAQAKLQVAQADLGAEEAALKRLVEEVPRRIAVAEMERAAAQAEEERAAKALDLTRKDVEQTIRLAGSNVDAAQAVFVNADEDFRRFTRLFQEKTVAERRFEEATKVYQTAKADLDGSQAKLARAEAAKVQIAVAEQAHQAARHLTQKATESVQLARVGNLQIEESRQRVKVKTEQVEESRRALTVAQTNLNYTRVTAPFFGNVVKRYRRRGDYAPVGTPILSVYNTELVYVTAHMEETRLAGISPGNWVRIDVDAFREPFKGRVVWLNQATGANFALVPRDLSSGEFTRVVQRVPIRIWIEKDERWPQLRPGLSATVAIEHGPGDPDWAGRMAREMLELEAKGQR